MRQLDALRFLPRRHDEGQDEEKGRKPHELVQPEILAHDGQERELQADEDGDRRPYPPLPFLEALGQADRPVAEPHRFHDDGNDRAVGGDRKQHPQEGIVRRAGVDPLREKDVQVFKEEPVEHRSGHEHRPEPDALHGRIAVAPEVQFIHKHQHAPPHERIRKPAYPGQKPQGGQDAQRGQEYPDADAHVFTPALYVRRGKEALSKNDEGCRNRVPAPLLDA